MESEIVCKMKGPKQSNFAVMLKNVLMNCYNFSFNLHSLRNWWKYEKFALIILPYFYTHVIKTALHRAPASRKRFKFIIHYSVRVLSFNENCAPIFPPTYPYWILSCNENWVLMILEWTSQKGSKAPSRSRNYHFFRSPPNCMKSCKGRFILFNYQKSTV